MQTIQVKAFDYSAIFEDLFSPHYGVIGDAQFLANREIGRDKAVIIMTVDELMDHVFPMTRPRRTDIFYFVEKRFVKAAFSRPDFINLWRAVEKYDCAVRQGLSLLYLVCAEAG